ncbi:hypothetical protein QFZ31_000994 [Neobacillus niacini]|nr:hypothetical protein [Neobacillus niacini]
MQLAFRKAIDDTTVPHQEAGVAPVVDERE